LLRFEWKTFSTKTGSSFKVLSKIEIDRDRDLFHKDRIFRRCAVKVFVLVWVGVVTCPRRLGVGAAEGDAGYVPELALCEKMEGASRGGRER
jgi:hypothetical protein